MTMQPRETLARSLDLAGSVIAGVDPDQWSVPTPCSDYDAVRLTEHLLGAIERPGIVARGGAFEGEIEVTGLVPEGGFGPRFDAARAETLDAFEGDAVMEQLFTLPWATLPGSELALMYAMEVAQHSWDLAVATGQDDKLDDELAEELLPVAERMLPAAWRGGESPFGVIVEVPASARAADRLAGFLGRSRP
jgi:uncharacterized protein (TIGR03086 family)